MKAINLLHKLLAVAALLVLASCQIDEEFERYNPDTSSIGPGSITYTDLSVYPVPGVVTTAEPVLDISASYGLVLGEIVAPEGSTFNPNNFSIDKVTGVITYDNENADLSEGAYLISVGITTINGLVVVDEAVTITVLSVPVTLSVDNTAVSAGALDIGLMATVSYSDLSGEGLVTSVAYSLVSPPAGFTIDAETGAISKSVDALEGPNQLTVQAVTNLGTVTAENLLTVTVGAPPTIEYFQQDGTTPLTKVTVSPWTAYSSSNPTLTGMDAANGYTVDLPAELDAYSGSFSIAANGSISVAANADLPNGTYSIGVTATNTSNISKEFTTVFELVVETRTTEIVNDSLGDDDAAGDDGADPSIYPGWTQYMIDAVSKWIVKEGVQGYFGFRVFKPELNADLCLTREVDITGYKSITVAMGEVVNNSDGEDFVSSYDWSLHYSDNVTDISAVTPAFDPANWTTILAADDPQWLTASNWKDPSNRVTATVDMTGFGSNTVYLNLRLIASPTSTAIVKNGQYWLDYLVVEGAKPFAAEED